MRAPRHPLPVFVTTAALTALAVHGALRAQSGTVLVQEAFEDTAYASRGWYDSSGGALSSTEKYAGSFSFECRFAVGGTGCLGKTPGRHALPAGDAVYISYYVKYSANWMGSGKPYHPHMFLVMTDADGAYVGPAYTHLTAYLEDNAGVPVLGIQDGRNIDETRVGQDLTRVAEQRAVAGCNGDSDGYGNGDCYRVGTVHWNGKLWKLDQVWFDNSPSSARYKSMWHLVEAYFKLNAVVNGKAVADGVLRYWYDGALVFDRPNVMMRTGANASMRFNQLQVAPYIGDGSPADQSFWVDDLLVATARPASPPRPPAIAPSAPENLRIVSP